MEQTDYLLMNGHELKFELSGLFISLMCSFICVNFASVLVVGTGFQQWQGSEVSAGLFLVMIGLVWFIELIIAGGDSPCVCLVVLFCSSLLARPQRLLQGHDGPAYDVKFCGNGENSLLLRSDSAFQLYLTQVFCKYIGSDTTL